MKTKLKYKVKYKQQISGDVILIPKPFWRAACCDCGLVHDFTFFRKGGKLFAQVTRNNRATAAKRRYRK